MRIVIAHQAVENTSRPDDFDVLCQVETVENALKKIGHDPTTLPCTSDLVDLRNRLIANRPDLVFNLVESLDGRGDMIHLFPRLLDDMGIIYTGAPSHGILSTSDKISAKMILQKAGLPTPVWIGPYPAEDGYAEQEIGVKNRTWLIKSRWEHASIGLDENEPLLYSDQDTDIVSLMKQRAPVLGGACFAEEYIDGREFNVAVFGGKSGLQVLSPAEILFESYPDGKPKIVGYRAKWDTDAYEYHHTMRKFHNNGKDRQLTNILTSLTKRCWRIFGLKGYARVDFRVDSNGCPWILEVNTNPCLSPDAGFAAALENAGISYETAVEQIILNALN